MKKIYFDNAATTCLDQRVFQAMKPYFSDRYGNASSLHSFGLAAKKALEESRQVLAEELGAKHNEIIFTSGATEADNLALRGIAYANSAKGNHIITTAIEHPAVMETCRFLETQGLKVSFLPVDQQGKVNLEALKRTLTKNTILVSIILANNEIGTIQPLKKISEIVKNYNSEICLHTDAVQAFTKLEINVKKINIDLLSLSSHKIYGPKGIGALYVRQSTSIEKILHGGRHEYNLRPGTENIAGIVGFAKAVQISRACDYLKLKKLRNYFISRILKEIPQARLNGPKEKDVLPNIINFSFAGVEGEAIMLLLDKDGIAVSTGSACASASLEPSYVLRAIGLPSEQAHGSIRISLGKDNTQEEIDYGINCLEKAVRKLRKIAPKV